jgi:hypothetical protein
VTLEDLDKKKALKTALDQSRSSLIDGGLMGEARTLEQARYAALSLKVWEADAPARDAAERTQAASMAAKDIENQAWLARAKAHAARRDALASRANDPRASDEQRQEAKEQLQAMPRSLP